jgi:hypothetical protein
VVFSVSGDAFLKGQVRRILGVMVGMARGLLPENYFELCTGRTTIAEVPALPGWGLYLAECKYAYYEAKFEAFRLDPRRNAGADTSRVEAWKTAIHTHIADISRTVGDGWLAEFEANCRNFRVRMEQMQVLMDRPRAVLEDLYVTKFQRPAPVLATAALAKMAVAAGAINSADKVETLFDSATEPSPTDIHIDIDPLSLHPDPVISAAYARVLRLLQEADRSGLWPANSTGRQKVILNAPAVVAAAGETDADLPSNNIDESTAIGAEELNEELAPSSEVAGAEDKVPAETSASTTSTVNTANTSKAPRKQRSKGNHKSDQKNNNRAKKLKTNRDGTSPVPTDENNDRDSSSTPSSQEQGDDAEAGLTATRAPKIDRTGTKRKEKAPLQPAHRRLFDVAVELVSDKGVGGSFSVGCLPKHLAQPKGNTLFPGKIIFTALFFLSSNVIIILFYSHLFCFHFRGVQYLCTELLRACFDLERVICPHRPPSSTIAINRHAQFSPHRDSGAGSGQSQSLIVALGDFTGGEIAVENTAHDIRYAPLEFDGWMERHWTLPFVGQRFSLVWFTPLGITEDDLWWWKQ